MYIYFYIYAIGYLSAHFMRRAFAFKSMWRTAIPHLSAPPSRGSICIVIHRQTVFVISQLFSVARHARCFKLGLKPG